MPEVVSEDLTGKRVCPICFDLTCPCSEDGINDGLNEAYDPNLIICPNVIFEESEDSSE